MQNALNAENNNESIDSPSLMDKIMGFKQFAGAFVNEGIFIGRNKISHFRKHPVKIINSGINIVNRKMKAESRF
jgi:hypothetical protein